MSVKEFSAALIVNERAVEHALDQLYRNGEYNGEESGYGEDKNQTGWREPRGFQLRNIAGGLEALRPRRLRPWV